MLQTRRQHPHPPAAVWKSLPGWILLTRPHALEILLVPTCCQADLVCAWGRGQWTETNGGVFAPEEVYFPTMLSILGYLRDDDVTEGQGGKDGKGGTGGMGGMGGKGGKAVRAVQVERRMVTYAEWARRGDANPIKFSPFTRDLVQQLRYRSSGSGSGNGSGSGSGSGRGGAKDDETAVFARKFDKGSVTLSEWLRGIDS